MTSRYAMAQIQRATGLLGLSALVGGTFVARGAEAQEAVQLEQVVVTAEKRPEWSQDVPATINTLSAASLAQANIKDLFQAADYVPGMVFSRAPDDGLGLTLRGVGTSARPQAFEQSVGLFLDGVFLGKGRLYTPAFFDLNRAEVIEGTQGTVLGKNTSVGAISLVPNLPVPEASLNVHYGAELIDGGESLDVAANVPATPEILLRFAGHYNDTNGWVHNTATGRQVPNDRDTGFRAIALFAPDEPFTARVSFQMSDSRRLGVPYQIIDPNLPPAFGEGQLNGTEAEFTDRTRSGDAEHRLQATLTAMNLDWRLAGGYMLSSQSAYVEYGLNMDDDFDFSIAPWIDFLRYESYHQLSQELRFTSPQDRNLQYLAGLYWLHSDWHSIEQQLWGVPAWPPPPAPISGQLFNGPFTDDFTESTNCHAEFAQATLRVAPRLRITAGLRHTRESKDTVYGRSNSDPITIWNTLANPPFAATRLPYEHSFVDGNASLQWDVVQDVMAYAAYGQGTKTGGYVETNSVAYPVFADPAVDSFIKPETTRTLELGVKSQLVERRLQVNAAVFDIRITDYQDTNFTGSAAGFITENLPLVTSRGAEISTVWQATGRLRFALAVTYARAEETLTQQDYVLVPGITCGPCRSPQAPLWNGTADGDYSYPVLPSWSAHFNVHARYRGAMFNQRGQMFPSGVYNPVDLGLELAKNDASRAVRLYVSNVNNRLSEDFASPSVAPQFAGLASPAPLRALWLSARARF